MDKITWLERMEIPVKHFFCSECREWRERWDFVDDDPDNNLCKVCFGIAEELAKGRN